MFDGTVKRRGKLVGILDIKTTPKRPDKEWLKIEESHMKAIISLSLVDDIRKAIKSVTAAERAAQDTFGINEEDAKRLVKECVNAIVDMFEENTMEAAWAAAERILGNGKERQHKAE